MTTHLMDATGGYAGEPEPVTTHTTPPPIQVLEDDAAEMLAPITWAQLEDQRPERGPVVIDGILREGALATIVSGSKCRKSFLVGALAGSVLSGGRVPWLGYTVTPGRVCIIDGELTLSTLYFRFRKIFEAIGVDPSSIRNNLDIYSLRGKNKDVARATRAIMAKGPRYYKLIIIDPVSAFYPPDPQFSENDNAKMRKFYDDLLNFAGHTQAGVINIHHSTKGSQSEKSVTDVGSGAGAIARAGDAHLVLRPHQEKDAVVFDGVVRDFPEIVPSCWRWTFPRFTSAMDLCPDDLAGKRTRKSKTDEFLAGAPEAEPWTAKRFANAFITAQPKTLDLLQAEAEEVGILNGTAERYARQAVALGMAFKWDGKPGKPLRYATIPQPVANSSSLSEESSQ